MADLVFSEAALMGDNSFILRRIDQQAEKTYIKGLCVFQKSINKQLKSLNFQDCDQNPKIKCILNVTMKSSRKKSVLLAAGFEIEQYNDHGDYNLKVTLLNHDTLQTVFLYNFKGDKSKTSIKLGEATVENFAKLYVDSANNYKIIFELTAKMTKIETPPAETLLQDLCTCGTTKDAYTQTSKLKYANEEDTEQTDDFLNLLNSGNFSDLTIILGEQKIQVHKAILAARSPIFSDMFKKPGEMDTHNKSEVQLTDVSYEVLQELLCWIYTGKIKSSSDKVLLELLKLVVRFAIDSALPIYEKKVIGSLALENSIECLAFADASNLKKLKLAAMDYIITNIKNFDVRQLEKLDSAVLAELMIESHRKDKK